MGNWKQLTSGGGYDFDEKVIFGPFTIEDDVAWPLTAPRYGNCLARRRQWSVALHSVAVARTVFEVTGNAEAAAAGLMHDCHEAIIGDITTPLGNYLGKDRVKELKADVDAAIYLRLGIPFDLLPTRAYKSVIAEADLAALHVERHLWAAPEPRSWNLPTPDHKLMVAVHRHTLDLEEEFMHANDWRERTPDAIFLDEYRRLVQPHIMK